MTSSQHFVPINDVRDDLIFLKDGSVTMVVTTSAVNFGLLFETEQISLIESFAGFLNSLSFPIQIVIRSRKLDVSSYLNTIDKAYHQQANPLLKMMTARYRHFVESIIKENNVLDKQFYVCINISAVELGVFPKNTADKVKQVVTILTPRKEHIVRQLARLGLKTRQLNTVELIKLFYGIYNPEATEMAVEQAHPVPANIPQMPVASPPRPLPPFSPSLPPANPYSPQPLLLKRLPPTPIQSGPTHYPLAPPFVVEELADDFGP